MTSGPPDDVILDAIGEGICALNREGRVIFVNATAARMLGGQVRDLIGTSVHELLAHPGSDSAVRSQVQYPMFAPLGDGRTHRVAGALFRRRDNSTVSVSYTSAPLFEDSKPAGLVVVFRDTTELENAERALRASEARKSAMLETALECVISIDHAGRITEFNRAAEAVFGYTRGELLGQEMAEKIIPPRLREAHYQSLWRYLHTGKASVLGKRIEVDAMRADGSEFPAELAILRIPIDGPPEFIAYLRDITDRKRAEAELRASEERYRSLATATASVVWTAAPNGAIVDDSPSWQAFTGQTSAEYKGFGWRAAVHPDDLDRTADIWRRAHRDKTSVEIEDRLRHHDGSYRYMLVRAVPVLDPNGRLREWVGYCSDISERKQAEDRLSYLANYDALTKLPNRLLFMDRLSQALAQVPRHERLVALLFIDLDRFKNVNDALGHEIGDLLLQAIARRLTGCVRESDTVARLGGDEFVVMLTEITRPADATVIAQKLVDALNRPFEIEDRVLTVDASIGISLYPKDAVDAKTLLKNADTAMYQAKHRGRNQYRQYSPSMGARAVRRLSLENDLRRGLDNNEFELRYQPQIELVSGRISAAEVFLRWRRQGRNKLIPPADFIREAEAQGLIASIGDWMVRTACAQGRLWQDRGMTHLRVAVNLAQPYLRQLNIKKTVRRILEDCGLEPARLEIELGEGLLRAPEMAGLLRALKTTGVGIAIDEFGTGYSALSYLRRFSIEKLKVDRSFMRGIPGDANNEAIMNALIAMAHGLGVSITAEGVQMPEQLDFLRALGCDGAQGYLLSKPLSAEDLTSLLLAEQAACAPVCAAHFYPTDLS